MTKIYVRSGDYIRERRFEVLAPAYYHPDTSSTTLQLTPQKRERVNRLKFVPTNFLNPAPFRMNVDPDEMQFCSYPIETMLDMFQKRIPFEVKHDHDIPEIFDNLDRYLLMLKGDVEAGIEYSTNYAKLVIRWRAEVYKHYYRYMMLNPTAKDELYPNNNEGENIFSLLAMIGGLDYDDLKRDPLRARANPPYSIEDAVPQPIEQQAEKEIELDSPFASSQTAAASKFDLQGFLDGR